MEIKLIRWFVYEWGKSIRQKPHRVILRSQLSRIHYYHSKRLQVKESQYLVQTYIWTLTLIPNWTCSVMTISHFQCMAPSMWLTNSMRGSHYMTYSSTWERCWLKSFLVYHTIKITKFLGHKTSWCTNIAASVSSHNLHKHNFASHLRNLLWPLK